MSIFPTIMKLKMPTSCDDGRVTMLRGMISQSQNSRTSYSMEETYVFLVVSPQRSQYYKSTISFKTTF